MNHPIYTNSYWGNLQLDENTPWVIRFGTQKIQLSRNTHSIVLGQQELKKIDFSKSQEQRINEETELKHFLTKQNASVILRPGFLRKSILVKPLTTSALLPKESIDICVSIPTLFQVITNDEKKWGKLELIHLAELPIVEQIIKKSFDFIRSIY